MRPAAGLPLPGLTCGRFAYSVGNGQPSSVPGGVLLPLPTAPEATAARMTDDADGVHGWVAAYTDEALFSACGVRIVFTERTGGASDAPFDSLNLKHGLGDGHMQVERNQTALRAACGIDCPDVALVVPNQVHGTDIIEVLAPHDIACAEDSSGSDAVLVALDNVAALLCFADCLPLVIVAPTGAFCVVHCGWKGTVAHLAAQAAERLSQVASCAPAQLNAYIGAYIHAECFAVGDDVAARFAQEFSPSVAVFDRGQDQWHVDLGAAVLHDLQSCGMVPDRIADVGKCTVCNQRHFFSYRASGGTCGRHGALAVRVSQKHGKEGR